ncbi:MAG: ubiquinone/menaquinone biosynthesis methyltransferase [Fimbriimonadales bacterium]|nr:ubiquinone/menaquinone biosynthesis methyltransferase [Fimbriimonadales bacterium]
MGLDGLQRAPWEAEGAAKRQVVREIFAAIAPRYDLMNSLMSLARHRRWREEAVRRLRLRGGETVLDLCCGTGDFMAPLLRAVGPRGRVVGADFCPPMLQRARNKGFGHLAVGDACRLPFRDGSFQAATVGWGLRNVADLRAALTEVARVLAPGGRFVSVDTAPAKGALGRWVSGFAFRRVVPLVGALFGYGREYAYLPESTERFLSPEQLAEEFRIAGFEDVWIVRRMLGHVAMVGGTRR